MTLPLCVCSDVEYTTETDVGDVDCSEDVVTAVDVVDEGLEECEEDPATDEEDEADDAGNDDDEDDDEEEEDWLNELEELSDEEEEPEADCEPDDETLDMR